MKRFFFLILLLLVVPSLAFANAVPLSDLLTTADDYWKTSAPQRPVLIQGGKINSAQQYIPVPTSATMGLVGYASGAAALGGLAFYQHTGKDPATALIDGVQHVFNPVWVAFQENFVTPESYPSSAAQFVGVEAAIGAKLSDIAEFVKNSTSELYSDLKALVADHTGTGVAEVPSSTLNAPQGTYWNDQDGNVYGIGVGSWKAGYVYVKGTEPGITGNKATCLNSNGLSEYYGLGVYNGVLRYMRIFPMNGTSTTHVQVFYWSSGPIPGTAYPVSFPSDGGLNETGLAQALNDPVNAPALPQVQSALKEMPATQVYVAANMPPAASSASDLQHPSISPQALQQFFSDNAAQIANQATQTATDPNATPAEIAAAQVAADAAKATADKAQDQMQPEPETYTDVPLSGFEEPYNPGPFDIPDRFDTFLANVAGTGLFSLPSQYFNSLPGGGSPVYTVEAGTYGTHTIDLSETMGTGLAVLKTVLLLCFAFLSVRVVVLKR